MAYETDTLKRQKRQVKTVTLHRQNISEDWGIEISGNGWSEGEWIRKIHITKYKSNLAISKIRSRK